MNAKTVSAWIDSYNDTFGACGRGERPAEAVLDFYDEGMLITTDDVVVGPGAPQAVAWVRAQVESMQTSDYSHTDIVSRDVTVLNENTALFKGDFSRRDRRGEEVSAFTVTYLIYRAADQLRIGALALTSPA